MKKIIRIVTGFGRQMSKVNVNAYASSAAFFIFLSMVPIIILLCSLLPLTPLQKSDLMTLAAQVMPSPAVSLITPLIDSLYNSTVGIVSGAAIVTIWSASKGMLALMRGLNVMNGVVEDRNYVIQRIMAAFYTVLLLVILLLSMVLMVFGNTLGRVVSQHLSRSIALVDWLLDFLVLFKPLFAWGILTVAFMFIFAFVPNKKMRIKDQFPGALFTAITWNLFSKGFSIYIEHFNGFGVYGSLSTIIVVMLWLYFCMYLVLVGAHINRFAEPFKREIMLKR